MAYRLWHRICTQNEKNGPCFPRCCLSPCSFFCWGYGAFAQSQSNVLARIYFAGAAGFQNDANSAAFTNEFCSSPARALENQTLDKLSHAPGDFYKDKIPSGAGDGSAQLRPLLDDFLKSEWALEIDGPPASPEYALAIRLDARRAQLWQDNLRNLLWNHGPKSAPGMFPAAGELKKDLPAEPVSHRSRRRLGGYRFGTK